MNICIVGNGPLSEKNRQEIKSSDLCDKVVRFNDMKNMEPGEPVDLHVVRSWGNSWWGIAEKPNKKTNYTGRPDVDVPLIVIGQASDGCGFLTQQQRHFARVQCSRTDWLCQRIQVDSFRVARNACAARSYVHGAGRC